MFCSLRRTLDRTPWMPVGRLAFHHTFKQKTFQTRCAADPQHCMSSCQALTTTFVYLNFSLDGQRRAPDPIPLNPINPDCLGEDGRGDPHPWSPHRPVPWSPRPLVAPSTRPLVAPSLGRPVPGRPVPWSPRPLIAPSPGRPVP
ncbi:hypothetical protein PAPYR_4588 [Paratrimastix pyriformis]|uniref:Uncharacterized protein n=1 Tax=Paratrimastix pyriformis TaxID=342808 RepID=A0ABQ8UML2_9EUKA|nr:hypothetical protein PAPYR_4588 [Paratrimastix pyriformis]